MSRQTIKINGKHYDAITGELLAGYASPDDHDTQVDTHSTVVITAAPTKSAQTPITTRPAKPSKILMRSAVKKPAKSVKTIRVQPSIVPSKVTVPVAPKPSVTTVSHARLERAKTTLRSEHVSRFSHDQTAGKLAVQYTHVPVRIAPNKPEEIDVTAGAPQPKPTNSPDDMFMRAIAAATHHADIKTHTRSYQKKAHRHFASMAIGASALFIIAGFATYLNTPSLQIRAAGLQAGVSTMSPDFAAAGFAYTGVTATQTKRVIGLKTDEASYQLVQQPTNWAGGQMIDEISSVSASGKPNFKTVQFGNQTVYRLNNGNATWVKDGTWYQLNGERAISDTVLRSLVQNS